MEFLRQRLLEGIAELKLSVSTEQVNKLIAFINLVEKWNKAYNLTAIKSKQEMVALHLLDSLTVLPYLQGERIADVGTGAGLPGIPLAICSPDLSFTLLDSNAKKTRFVQQSVLELKLINVEIKHTRTEDFQPTQRFDTVLTRAFAELSDMIVLTKHLVTYDGKLIAMKAKITDEELSRVTEKKRVIPAKIPGVDAERNLVIIQFH